MSPGPLADGYREIQPHAALRDHVECYWVARGPGAARAILPDGCVDFLFDARDARGGARLVGAMTRALELPAQASRDVVAVRFRPGGARAFVRSGLAAFTDAAVELVDIDDRLLALARAGTATAAPAQRLRAIEAWLLQQVPEQPHGLVALLRSFGQGGVDSVAAAARAFGHSRQHFTRAVRDFTGLSPKRLSRILRLRRALAAPEDAAASAVALRCGYADQAHLARDVRELTGQTWTGLRGSDR